MPRALDTNVEIIAETPEEYIFEVANQQQAISKGQLNQMLSGGGDPIATFIGNLIVAASLEGLRNFDDTVAVQRLIKNRKFKIMRD